MNKPFKLICKNLANLLGFMMQSKFKKKKKKIPPDATEAPSARKCKLV